MVQQTTYLTLKPTVQYRMLKKYIFYVYTTKSGGNLSVCELLYTCVQYSNV